jgi:hypothetical protein
MAFMMVMTVCLLVYAALEYRLRTALKVRQETFPNQKGKPVQHPTARWIFQSFVGIHLLVIQGSEQLVLNRHEDHQQLLRLLGEPYEAYYSWKGDQLCGKSVIRRSQCRVSSQEV